MTRKEFLKNSLSIGIGLPFLSMFMESCDEAVVNPTFNTDFSGKVIIIGAGSAGMAAGYLLQRYGVDFQIIEASSTYGGRVKRNDTFTDFPIDVGAEWLHDNRSVLAELINDPTVDASIDMIDYNPQTFQVWNNGQLRQRNFARHFYSEYKFKSTTWFGFFEKFIVPSIADKMLFDTPITEINYSADKVQLTSQDNQIFEADKVIVTIPIKVLQGDLVSFVPTLPNDVRSAIDNIFMGDGFKAFIEFRERFYPDLLFTGPLLQEAASSDKTFYDAAFRKDTDKNILGLFSVNQKASVYAQLDTEQEMIDTILAELDEIYDGKASENYVQHIIQNWSKEPYIQGSYGTDYTSNYNDIINSLSAPLDNKILFAGEVLGGDNAATVHGAFQSGVAQVEKMLSL